MLVQLGKWLRAAGYDTLIADGRANDRRLLEWSIDEQRRLVTRDHKLLEFKHAQDHVLLLQGNALYAWIDVINEKIGLNWLFRPFSRCLVCNTDLVAAPPGSEERVPNKIREQALPLSYCTHCDKLYWEGSHVQQMRHQLQIWEQLRTSGGSNA